MKERMDLGSTVRDALPVYDASPELRDWVRKEARKLDEESVPERGLMSPTRARFGSSFPLRIAAGLVIAAFAGWGIGSLRPIGPPISTDRTTNELVDAHVRSLLPGHLLDVVSSDRHTVKPWFTGKTDIAPSVVDLSDRGFPLLGGRLDYVDGHSAATLAYGRRLHTINLFVWRSAGGEPADGSFTVRGYSLLHWTNGGLSYWAISDAAPSELQAFREAYTK
jgi:anti-sigma factor RsiW